ncbi:hypothetical protein JZM15_27360, partial [Escherichia coli]|nr:hypothetical protein [Escherichia coli]
MNDTDIKWKNNTNIESFDGNRDEKKEGQSTEKIDQITASLILTGEPLLSSLPAKSVQHLQTNSTDNRSVSNVTTRISAVN